MAEIKPASKVLDIATGIGEPAITVSRCVGTKGHVLATDISLQMLSIARQRAVSENLEKIIDFKEDDLDSGLSNIHKSLVNGGRFAASVCATSEKVP